MNTNLYEYFLSVAEEKSISKAAEKLYVTQQALSAQMQRLEETLGVALFDRKPAFRLTAAGERFVAYCQTICASERQMLAEMAELGNAGVIKLVIGCTRQRASIYFPEIWKRFHALHPNVIISLVERDSEQLVSMVQNGELDMAVVVNTDENPVYTRLPLTVEPPCCVVGRSVVARYWRGGVEDFISKNRYGVDLAQMADFPFILLSKNNRLRNSVDTFFKANKITPRVLFESSLHELVYELSAQGNGVGIMSRMFFSKRENIVKTEEPYYILPLLNNIKPSRSYVLVRKGLNSSQFTDLAAVICAVMVAGVPETSRFIELHNEETDRILIPNQ
jgi:DNA-binding transcriptional LysR family regulator